MTEPGGEPAPSPDAPLDGHATDPEVARADAASAGGLRVVDGLQLSARDLEAGRFYFGAQLDAAIDYTRHLCTTGVEHGLVGPREIPRMWERHVLNCAAAREVIPPGASIADVGSGAGLPGIVLALACADSAVTLIEPLERRVTWLRNTCDALGVDVDIRRGRAEEFNGVVRSDVVTARAVAHLGRLADWCAPLVKKPGRLVLLKGQSVDDELRKYGKRLRKHGFSDVSVQRCGAQWLEVPTTCLVAQR